jgi:hypothetical protein
MDSVFVSNNGRMRVADKLLYRYKTKISKSTGEPAPKIVTNVFSFSAYGLGDQCRLVNYLIKQKCNNSIIIVRRPLLNGIIYKLFDHNNSNNIFFANHGYSGKMIYLKHVNIGKYEKLTNCWKENNSKRIFIQLDGAHSNANNKNCSNDDILRFYHCFREYEIIDVNKINDINKCVELMSKSRLFIGIESGWSHIAHSSGIPCIILKNNQVNKKFVNYHIGNNFTLYKNINDLILNFDINKYKPNY